MMRFILVGIVLFFPVARSWAVTVDWQCSSQTTPVEVYLDSQAKLQFRPDVLRDAQKQNLSDVEIARCLTNFRKKISEEISKFKDKQCPVSKHDFCFTTVSYVDAKVAEKLGITRTTKQSTGSAEKYLEEKIAKKEIDPTKLNQTFNYGNQTYKMSDFDKVIGDNIENVFMELNREEARQYAQNYMVANADLLDKKEQSAKRTAVLNNLNRMFGYIYGDQGAEELSKMLECRPEDELKPIAEIIQQVEKFNKVSECESLKPGNFKVFAQDPKNYYGTGDYLLRRKNDGSYQAVLNVQFKVGTGSVTPQAMLNRAQGCLAKASPHMKGPNGELMEIVAMPSEEIAKLPQKQQPKVNVISIEEPNFGTNAASYAETVNCATITHEMLHLLGLCDEYKETRAKYGDMWNCRVVTKAPSIMRELAVFDQAVPKTNACECKHLPCKSLMRSANEDFKNIYTSQDAYAVMDYGFRSDYCKLKILPTSSNITEPSKAMLLKSNSDRSFVVENRKIVSQQGAPGYAVERYEITCACPVGNTSCMQTKEDIIQKVKNPKRMSHCPFGARNIEAQTEKTFAKPQMSDDVLYFTSEPVLESLLQPNHFHKILEGACPGKSSSYQECADFAYKNNRNSSCNVPAKCHDDGYYLGVPK